MKLTIVAGSHRRSSESARVASFIEGMARQRAGFEPSVLDLGKTPLPLWDEDLTASPRHARWVEVWNPISEQLAASEAFVFVAPEWSGMAPAALKNLLLLCDGYQLAHKPAMIVGISSGLGGSYPAAELRASSSKDTMICYIPTQIVIHQVKGLLAGPLAKDPYDSAVRQRLAYGLAILAEYAKALAAVRASGVINHQRFPYGM